MVGHLYSDALRHTAILVVEGGLCDLGAIACTQHVLQHVEFLDLGAVRRVEHGHQGLADRGVGLIPGSGLCTYVLCSKRANRAYSISQYSSSSSRTSVWICG